MLGLSLQSNALAAWMRTPAQNPTPRFQIYTGSTCTYVKCRCAPLWCHLILC